MKLAKRLRRVICSFFSALRKQGSERPFSRRIRAGVFAINATFEARRRARKEKEGVVPVFYRPLRPLRL